MDRGQASRSRVWLALSPHEEDGVTTREELERAPLLFAPLVRLRLHLQTLSALTESQCDGSREIHTHSDRVMSELSKLRLRASCLRF